MLLNLLLLLFDYPSGMLHALYSIGSRGRGGGGGGGGSGVGIPSAYFCLYFFFDTVNIILLSPMYMDCV